MADIFNTQLDLLKAVTPNAGGASYLEVQIGGSSTIPVTGTVVAKIEDSAGNPITSTGSALDVNLKSSSITLPVSLAGTSNVNVTNAAGASAVNIQDGGNSITVDGTVSISGTTTISGTVTANQGTSPWVSNVSQFGGNNVVTGTGTSGVGIPRVTVSNDSNILSTQSGTWNINNVSGTISLPTGAATESTLAKLPLSQASTTSGQSGALIQGAVTTAAPSYTTGQTDPLSLTTTGALRVDNSANTQPVSGTVTANAGTGNFTVVQATGTNLHTIIDSGTLTTVSTVTNLSQMSGTAISMNNGTTDAGTQRVTLSSDSTGQVKLATGANTIGALTANQSVNLAQVAGTTTSTGNGTANAGCQRVTIASDNTAFSVNATISGTSTVSTKTDLTPSSPTAATVGTSSAQALASNANRKGLILINTSANTISIGLGSTAVLNSGITLYPGGTFQMDEYCFDLGAVNSIASAASSNLAIQEFTT